MGTFRKLFFKEEKRSTFFFNNGFVYIFIYIVCISFQKSFIFLLIKNIS